MKETWKNNLGEYLASVGSYRLDYLNKELKEWCNDFYKYFDTFSGFYITLKFNNSFENGVNILKQELTIQPRDVDQTASFSLQCWFDHNVNLCMYYTKLYQIPDRLDGEFRVCQDEIFSENERFEKSYVLQLILDRMIGYFNSRDQVNKSRHHNLLS
jgi:hypothetical protein